MAFLCPSLISRRVNVTFKERIPNIETLCYDIDWLCGKYGGLIFKLLYLQDDSNNGSLYKSEILFSPVREVPLVNFSIDSLDCEEHDIMLTCQANKDNYTIAFEGSVLMEKSTDSRQTENQQQTEECKF